MAVDPNTAAALVDEIFKFGRSLRSAVAAQDTPTPLPSALSGVLCALAVEGECRQSELAAALCVSQSSLSRQMTELLDAGYIDRSPDPVDGRASRVRVSARGEECLALTRSIRVDYLTRMLSEWTEDQAQDAVESVRHLTTTFAGDARARHADALHTNPLVSLTNR